MIIRQNRQVMDDSKADFFIRFKEEVIAYIHLRIELFKISSYEKIAKVGAAVFSGLIMMVLFFFVMIFISLMAGFYFSELTGSHIKGFSIVTGIYFLLLMICIVFRKPLFEKILVNKMIEILFENDDKTDDKNK